MKTTTDPLTATANNSTESSSDGLADVFGKLICVRVLASGTVTRSQAIGAWKSLVADATGWGSDRIIEAFHAALDREAAAGRLISKPLRLTDAGREAAVQWLGFESAIGRPWATLKNRYLVAAALDINPSLQQLERLGQARGLYAAVLRHQHGLPLDDVPTPAAALDTLAWQQLAGGHTAEVPRGKRFTRNFVLAYVFLDNVRARDPARLLAALATGAAPRSDRIRGALLTQWLKRLLETADASDRETSNHSPSDGFEVAEFANAIISLACATLQDNASKGRFGRHKVFIDHLWQRYQDSASAGKLPQIDRVSFDARLLQANRHELLTLNRADLIEAMDAESVRHSEIRHPDGHSVFHFVRID